MKESHIRDMIKYITEAITTDIGKIDIYGSIYDEYSRKNLVTFNKKKNSNLSISYDGKGSIDYVEELYNFAYDEFYYEAKLKLATSMFTLVAIIYTLKFISQVDILMNGNI